MIKVLKIHPNQPEPEYIGIAAEALHQGKLVAFPTETVYGLGANALDARAVTRIFQAKGRPNYDPLIVHLAETSWLPRVAAEIPVIAWRLAEAFWPGPLTMILPKRSEVPHLVTAGLETVALRVPAHPVSLALLKAADVLVAAPSANRFGHTSPTCAEHVLADLGNRIDILVDGGKTNIGIESTVLDLSSCVPTILRPGGVTQEQLSKLLGDVAVQSSGKTNGMYRSPGQLQQHYSPRAKLIYLLGPTYQAALDLLYQISQDEINRGHRVGLLILDEDLPFFNDLSVLVATLGSGNDLWQAASRLYAGMRSLDEQDVDLILVRDLGERGPGIAIRDRLQRAATKIVC